MSNEKKYEVNVPYKIEQHSKEALQNNLPFLSEKIKAFHIDEVKGTIQITLTETGEFSDVNQKLEKLIDMAKPSRDGEMVHTLLDKSNRTFPNNGDIYPELLKRGDLVEVSPGHYALSGQFLKLYRVLDQKLFEFSKEFEAQEVVLPIVTTIETLKKINFFQKTPQFANFISLLKSDLDSISEFSHKMKDKNIDFQEHLCSPKGMCRSAICLNSYQLFENKVLAPEDFKTLTVFGKAFRNEEKNITTLERLHEFSMREFIFFGDKQYVTGRLEKCQKWFEDYLELAQLNSKIMTASDPFFANSIKSLQFFQFAEQSKVEIKILNPISGNYVAVGSLNNHGKHFSAPFNMKLSTQVQATTGCVGFGYERIIFTTMSQFGINLERWPDGLRKFWQIN